MDFEPLSFEEQAAVNAVASLGNNNSNGKRDREFSSGDAASGYFPNKAGRFEERAIIGPVPPSQFVDQPQNIILQPYPFFYYCDHSLDIDPDPLTPLTPPGRVPNFPAKMHSILSRPDLADIISWMPHGRAWRVLKPREFEVRVIPTYFEHAKFSSFIRQANGWGFRRITQGRDRNAYYHELFLRGLPHLCKKMKRPGVSEKQAADPDHEPDLYKISEVYAVPEKAEDDSILLHCTLEGGPKARMPIYSGVLSYKANMFDTKYSSNNTQQGTPRDQQALQAFQQALGASENQFANMNIGNNSPNEQQQNMNLAPSSFVGATPAPINMPNGNKVSPLAAANQLAFPSDQSNLAAAQFAAGFAAAAALSQQQFQSLLGSLAQGGFTPPQQTFQTQNNNGHN